jgi:hypothetical protein
MKKQNTETQSSGNATAIPEQKAASGCVRVTLPIYENKLDRETAYLMAKDYSDNARKMGGKARHLGTLTYVVIEHAGLTRDQSKSLIDQLTHSRSSTILKVSVEERDSVGFDLESPGIIPGEFAWKKLDKKFLFGLPNYAIIVGSGRDSEGDPVFFAKLEPGADRSIIWKRAVDSNAHHSPCAVHWSEEDVEEIYGFWIRTLLDEDAELPLPFRL